MPTKVTILIADDKANDRVSLRDLLEVKGYAVVEAGTTEETYLQAVEHVPDLILLDVRMPSENGYAVCARLRRDDRTSNIPIVMLTCYGLKEEKLQGFSAGADDYLLKPCDNDELLARIGAVLRRFPPKANFYDRLERAHVSYEAAEIYRRFVAVLNIDIEKFSVTLIKPGEEYLRNLAMKDYRCLTEMSVREYKGTPVAWAGDGGTAEFANAASACDAARRILHECSAHPRVSKLKLRIGLAAGMELIDPDSNIGERTSDTHNRAGHYQKQASPNTIVAGEEIVKALIEDPGFQLRSAIDGRPVFEHR